MIPSYRSTTVAEDWEHGLVAGNGSLGMMLFGRPGQHRVTFSHESVLLPADPPRRAPDLAPHLSELRRLIDDGRAQAAADLGVRVAGEEGYPGLQWTDPIVPVATLDLRGGAGAGESYERRVDLDGGEIELRWVSDGREHAIRGFVSRADDVAVLEVGDDVEIVLEAPENVATTEAGVRGGNAQRAVFSGGGMVEDEARLELRFRADWLTAGSEGATTRVRILRRDGGRLLLGIRVDPRGPAVRAASSITPAWPDGDYVELLARHREERARTIPPATVRLSPHPPTGRSTEELLAAVDDPASARELLDLQLAASASLVDASTGVYAPTLQGIWSGSFDPAWSSDFTMNGNVQNGAVAASLSGGAPHQLRTWIDMIVGFAPDLRDNAERLFGAEGWLLPSRSSWRHGLTTHFDEAHCHEFWTAGGAWAAAMALDETWHTADLDRLAAVHYPFAREVERFYESFLQRENGVLLFSPSYSPENLSPTFDSQACRNAAQDRAALAVLLRGLLRASELLGIDEELTDRRTGWLSELPPYRIAPDGTLAEWLDDGVEEVVGHRTASQLLELWFEPPADLSDGPVAEAVARLVERKLDWRADGNESMAYGLVQLGLAAVAVRRGDLAGECVRRLSRYYSLPSLSTTHDNGAIFNLDGAGGLPSIVHAMIVASRLDRLDLLSAIPEEWSSGSAGQISARGGVVVEELRWGDGVAAARLRALPGSERIRGSRRLEVTIGGRGTRTFDIADGETLELRETLS